MEIYQVYLNGDKLVYKNANKKSCLRKCLSLAKKSSNYVELWCAFSSGKRTLVNYWN